jgi:nitrogen fixation protein FixH
VASQDYNNVLADARRQQELGWRSTLDAGAQGLSLTIRDRDGRPVSGLNVEAHISRPTHERDDRTIALAERGAGNYLAEEALAPGAWKIEIQAQDRAGRPYRRQFRIVRPGPR